MGALLPVEQYYRYWELDSSSTPSPPSSEHDGTYPESYTTLEREAFKEST
jgi:hypothetical protein